MCLSMTMNVHVFEMSYYRRHMTNFDNNNIMFNLS